MPDWASRLVETLGGRAQQIGLRADMPGEEFEAALGEFLAFEASLPRVGSFLHMDSPPQNPTGVNMAVLNWFNTSSAVVAEIRRGIWANLFESFGLDRIDHAHAETAYRALHDLIRAADGGGPESHIAHATTNYDPAIEVAVVKDERLALVDGFAPRPGAGTAVYSPNLFTSQWINSTAHVPVVHIHGAVGWYLRSDGSIMRRPSDEPYDERQTPALLLPDDQKDPTALTSPARATWSAFNELLQEATHVLVVGHSLHDRHILDALRSASKRTAFVELSLPNERGVYSPPSATALKRYAVLLPNVTVISGCFGQRAPWHDIDERPLERWLLGA